MALLSLPNTLQLHVLSLLLALSLSNYSPFLYEFFLDATALEDKAKQVRGVIKHAGAARVLWERVDESDDASRNGLCRVLETLFASSHRNAGVIASLGIVGDVFARWKAAKETGKDSEKLVLQKLLRKLLELGASTAEARGLFQAAVRADGHDRLDADILDVIRFGMKSRWVEHFSIEGKAAVVLGEGGTKWKTLPKDGLSFLVSIFQSFARLLANQAGRRCGSIRPVSQMCRMRCLVHSRPRRRHIHSLSCACHFSPMERFQSSAMQHQMTCPYFRVPD